MADFLLELRSEEIPARMQDKARDDLARLFSAELEKSGLRADAIVTFATPRRLALIARDLPAETAAVSEEVKGPRVGAPPQALEGFLRKTGLTTDQLVERDGVLFAIIDRPGRATADVLASLLPWIIFRFPWPKSMRWGASSISTESLKWVRPLQGIVALFGDQVVDFTLDHLNITDNRDGQVFGENVFTGLRSGAATVGHRFHHPGPITIGSAADYEEKLRACHVIVDHDQRRAIVRDRAAALAAEAGLELIEDEGLVAENAGLTEWPVPLLGRFDADFLEVPPEVIQLTARVNQKYFVCRDRADKLANAFVCTANIDAADGGAAIVEGNRKVLAARLSDARFFYETDLKVPLEEQARKLDKIVFHEKLGTVADKVERVAKLARWLVEEGIVTPAKAGAAGLSGKAGAQNAAVPCSAGVTELAAQAERAARLAKADLVTGMVGEFPELQGLMGGYYAAAQGEHAAVAEAVRDHYKPVGQGDDVPTAPVTVAVSLADKLDTLAAFFTIKERPTGSKDPFALRRAGIAIASIILSNHLRVPLAGAAMKAMFGVLESRYDASYHERLAEIVPALLRISDPKLVTAVFTDVFPKVSLPNDPDALVPVSQSDRDNAATLIDIIAFLFDRLKVQQREAGVRHDLIDAVFALGGEDDLVRLLARVRALQSFVGTEDGANLLAGYKRAANILKKEGYVTPAKAGAAGLPGDGDAPNAAAPASAGATEIPLSYTPENAEADLIAALDAAEPAAADAVAREDFEAAMAALATLRAPIDAFFDAVTVNDPEPAKRAARLALLARVRDAVHSVADFSKIEG